MNNFYIYIYLDTRESGRYLYENFSFLYKPVYIGKGKDERYKKIYGRSEDFVSVINEIKEVGLEPIKFKLYENLNENQSLEIEKRLIKEMGRLILGTGTLVNRTSGGQGISGYKHTEETLKKLKKDFSNIKKEFEKRNYILLTEENEYETAFTKLEYICSKGHKNYIRWNDFQQQHSCPYCKRVKIDFSNIKKEFERRKYILLTEEKDYKNSKDTKLKYICSEGHECYTIWRDFQQERCGCYICWKKLLSEKMKSEANPSSILIIQDVIQIKLLLKEGKLTQREIADIFGVSQLNISAIKTGKSWSYIKI